MTHRRELLLRSAAVAGALADLMKALGHGAPAQSKEVALSGTDIATRVKMGPSSKVFAVAITGDGKLL